MGLSFVALGLSGLTILFGKHVLLPILGYTLFAWLTGFAKNLHNFVAPLFIVSLPIFIAIYIRDNLPEKGDLKWMLNAYKMFLGQHMPSGKYNAGEKTWFWGGVVFCSLILCVSGAVLLFPSGIFHTRQRACPDRGVRCPRADGAQSRAARLPVRARRP